MRITGQYTLKPIGPRLFVYLPDSVEPLTFTSDSGRVFVLGDEFETDLASIPRPFWVLPGFSPFDWIPAALLHDWLWERRKGLGLVVGFWASNRLLAQAIKSLGQPRWRAWVCKRAIDAFGWWQWIRDEKGCSDE